MEDHQDIRKFLEPSFGIKNNHQSRMEFNPTFEFCNSENINSCLIYLNQELMNHGMQPLFANINDFNISSLVNSTFEALQKIRHLVVTRDTLEESKHKALCEVQHLEAEKKRLRSKLSTTEKELAESKNKVDCLCRELTEKDIKIKNDKEEVRSLQAALRSKEMQHKNSMRREEKEINRLKDQLGGLLSGKRGPKLPELEGNCNHFQKFSTNNSHEGNQSDFLGIELKVLSDLKRLKGRLCSINAKYTNIGSIPEPNSLRGWQIKSLIKIRTCFSDMNQFYNVNEILKCMDEEISKIQNKCDAGYFAGKDWRRALKDKNNYKMQSLNKCVNKASSDSTWRPKSAVQHANKKRLESKALPSRSRSIMLANTKTCHRYPQSMIMKDQNAVVDHSQLHEGNIDRKPKHLIRSESYTVLKDQDTEYENAVNIDNLSDDIVSQDDSIIQCPLLASSFYGNNNNKTFVCGETDKNFDNENFYF